MNEIWMVNCSGALQAKNGFFETEEECQKKCDSLTEKFKGDNSWYFPYRILKGYNE